MSDFGKLNYSVSLKPTSAFPLDARCYFDSLVKAEAAAATAEEVGSTNTIYYYGQKLVVVENNVATWYTIQPNKTLEVDGSGNNASGDMQKSVYDTDNNGKVDNADNAEKLGGQSPDYYAKKDELPSKVSELENDKGYLTEHQSLEGYAKKTDIPTIPTKVSAFENDKGYLTQHQDLSEYAKTTDIPTKVSQLTNDEGYLKEHQSLVNYYTKSEVTEELNKKQDALDKYVKSVNGYSGEVKLSASDVNALPDTTVIPTVPNVVSAFTNDADYASRTYVSEVAAGKCKAYTFETVTELDEWLTVTDNTTKLNNGDVFYIRAVGVPDYWWDEETQSKQILETTKVDLTGYAKSGDIPINVSQLTNDANYITESKVDTKLGSKQDKLTEYVSSVNGKSGAVNLTCTDVGAMPENTPIPTVPTKVSAFENDKGYLTEHQSLAGYAKSSDIPTTLSQLSQDSTHRIVTDTEKATWNAKSNFSGSYNDLTNKPTIPTVPSSLPANGGNADTVDNYHIAVSSSAPTTNNTKIITIVV